MTHHIQIIKPDSRGGQRGGLAELGEKREVPAPSSLNNVKKTFGKVDPVMESRIKESLKVKFNGKSQLFITNLDREVDEWPDLFKLKLLYCYRAANFQAESKKAPEEVEFRDTKRETLIELIDVLDEQMGEDYLHTEAILQACMNMIEANIFRTFQNKNNKKHQQVDPDEDEPHLEEAWPHLQLVYELFLKFMMSNTLNSKVMAQNISQSFIS